MLNYTSETSRSTSSMLSFILSPAMKRVTSVMPRTRLANRNEVDGEEKGWFQKAVSCQLKGAVLASTYLMFSFQNE